MQNEISLQSNLRVHWADKQTNLFSLKPPNNFTHLEHLKRCLVLPPPHCVCPLSQDGNVLVVSGLHPASLYRLEVQAITAEGEGPATRRTFQTPGYQSSLKHSKH